MSNINDGVGKKIVEALKKQSELESGDVTPVVQTTDNPLGMDISPIDEITNNGLLSDIDDTIGSVSESSEDNVLGIGSIADNQTEETFNDFNDNDTPSQDSGEIPGNILILKRLVSQLPSGVTRHTGAQIIRQTMEALGISMKSVLTEAQEVQHNLKESSKECQMTIQEYKQKISNLEKQTQNYQKQYSALNDLISLFIQTGK